MTTEPDVDAVRAKVTPKNKCLVCNAAPRYLNQKRFEMLWGCFRTLLRSIPQLTATNKNLCRTCFREIMKCFHPLCVPCPVNSKLEANEWKLMKNESECLSYKLPKVEILRELILASKKMAIVTGAGISTGESARLPTFRLNSLGEMNVERLNMATPTISHRIIEALLKVKEDSFLFTYNIDGLHLEVKEHQLFEVHGNIRNIFCERCSADRKHCKNDCLERKPYVRRHCVAAYGEKTMLFTIGKETFKCCDLVIFIGCSLQVGALKELVNQGHIETHVLINPASHHRSIESRAGLWFKSESDDVLTQLAFAMNLELESKAYFPGRVVLMDGESEVTIANTFRGRD